MKIGNISETQSAFKTRPTDPTLKAQQFGQFCPPPFAEFLEPKAANR